MAILHEAPNKLCPFFPRRLSDSRVVRASAVFLVRSLTPYTKKASAWIVSVQETEAGKLLLRHALTHQPIAGSSGHSLDLSGWSLTRIALSHSMTYGDSGGGCNLRDKVVLVGDPIPVMVTFRRRDPTGLCLRRSYNDTIGYVTGAELRIDDFVNFNGCVYAVDVNANVYVIDHTGSKPPKLVCANVLDSRWALVGIEKRFVVSDGDLYLVVCEYGSQYYGCEVYKLVPEDAKFKKATDLGDRVLFITRDSSFSVSARDLPPPLVGNCVVFDIGAFSNPRVCFSGFHVYHVGPKANHKPAHKTKSMATVMVKAKAKATTTTTAKGLPSMYSALFTPPPLWTKQIGYLNRIL